VIWIDAIVDLTMTMTTTTMMHCYRSLCLLVAGVCYDLQICLSRSGGRTQTSMSIKDGRQVLISVIVMVTIHRR